jgi:fumarate reductase subunit D
MSEPVQNFLIISFVVAVAVVSLKSCLRDTKFRQAATGMKFYILATVSAAALFGLVHSVVQRFM